LAAVCVCVSSAEVDCARKREHEHAAKKQRIAAQNREAVDDRPITMAEE
jgi:hypothetical protein